MGKWNNITISITLAPSDVEALGVSDELEKCEAKDEAVNLLYGALIDKIYSFEKEFKKEDYEKDV